MTETTTGPAFAVVARCPAGHAWDATVRTERRIQHTGIGHRPSATSRKLVAPECCPACGELWASAGGWKR